MMGRDGAPAKPSPALLLLPCSQEKVIMRKLLTRRVFLFCSDSWKKLIVLGVPSSGMKDRGRNV